MATRETFLQELKNLNQEVITMSQMVQDAIDSSFQALSEHNTELADKIIKGDRDVDNMERKIETRCLIAHPLQIGHYLQCRRDMAQIAGDRLLL